MKVISDGNCLNKDKDKDWSMNPFFSKFNSTVGNFYLVFIYILLAFYLYINFI